MKKHIRIMLASVCAFAMVGAFALIGCSSNTEQQAGEAWKPPKSRPDGRATRAVELQLFAANSQAQSRRPWTPYRLYTQDHTWVTFKDTQYLSSGELNEQLAGGVRRRADLRLQGQDGRCRGEGLCRRGRLGFDMFKNDLVMVAGEDSELAAKYADQSFTLDDLATGDYTVAVGDASVPAGNYTNQALSHRRLLHRRRRQGRQGQRRHRRLLRRHAAGGQGELAGVPWATCASEARSGAVDVAFVYSSDVYRFGGVKVIGVVPDDTHKNIIYPAAICKDSTQAEAANEFIEWATTNADQEALAGVGLRAGFLD